MQHSVAPKVWTPPAVRLDSADVYGGIAPLSTPPMQDSTPRRVAECVTPSLSPLISRASLSSTRAVSWIGRRHGSRGRCPTAFRCWRTWSRLESLKRLDSGTLLPNWDPGIGCRAVHMPTRPDGTLLVMKPSPPLGPPLIFPRCYTYGTRLIERVECALRARSSAPSPHIPACLRLTALSLTCLMSASCFSCLESGLFLSLLLILPPLLAPA